MSYEEAKLQLKHMQMNALTKWCPLSQAKCRLNCVLFVRGKIAEFESEKGWDIYEHPYCEQYKVIFSNSDISEEGRP